jgi:hypothetical protein
MGFASIYFLETDVERMAHQRLPAAKHRMNLKQDLQSICGMASLFAHFWKAVGMFAAANFLAGTERK